MPYTREQSDQLRRLAEAASGRKLNADGDPINGIELYDPAANKVVGRVAPDKPIELGSVDWEDDVEVDASAEPAPHPYQGFPTVNLTETAAGPGTSDVEPDTGKPGDLTVDGTMEEVYQGKPQEDTADSSFNQSEVVQNADDETTASSSEDSEERTGRKSRR